MLSLEQIKRLENRVYKAVELLKAMKEDNNILKSELKSANERVEELEQIISDYRNNQLEIEQGIVKAIQQLDDLDSIDDDFSQFSKESVSPAVISPEMQSAEGAKSPFEEKSSFGTGFSGIEQDPEIPVTADNISESKVSESEPERSTQQLDIF